MPGIGALIVIIGLGALAWIIIRRPKNKEQSKPQVSKPQKRG